MQPAGKEVQPDEAGIYISRLHKSYHTPAGSIQALDDISLQALPGEFVAVTGKSGAGKSTLVNMISGIDRSDSGQVLVAGTRVQSLGEDQRSRWRGLNLGIVFQFFQLLPSLNLVKNLTIAMDFCGRYDPQERRPRALHLLEQVGLADHAFKTPSEISGGQQQRVAVARALVNDPPVIIADEPTGNLDSHTAAEILDLLLELSQSGKTLLVVTHDRGVASIASRRIELLDGRLQ
ncbi:MAG: ABC transporter ATP-binding protein [Chloroflexi bacterium RBG_16_54_18]|nr:MAG: ABC transporter ATP-binding protein [Chloroflexi bacterium RBG_16_54_18]